MGFVYDDGPHPLGLRYQINSASLTFDKKPWFEIPEYSKSKRRELRKRREETKRQLEKYTDLLRDEELMGIGPYTSRMPETSSI